MASSLDMSLDDVIGKKAKKQAGTTAKKFAARKGKGKGGAPKAATKKKEQGTKGTDEKLEMTLEDLVNREVKTSAKGAGKVKKIGKFGMRTIAKRAQRDRETGKAKGKGLRKGTQKGRRKGKGKGKAREWYDDWAPPVRRKGKSAGKMRRWEEEMYWGGKGSYGWGRKGSKGKGKYDYFDDWEPPRKGGRKGKGKRDWFEEEDWGTGIRKGKGKRRDFEEDAYMRPRKGAGKRRDFDFDEDDFDRRPAPRRRALSDEFDAPAPKRARMDRMDDRDIDDRRRPIGGKGGGRDQFWGAGDPAPRRRPEEGSRREVSRHIGATRDPPARNRERDSGSSSIRVTNVPKNLDRRDIQEAFSDLGKVINCEVDRGQAFITFENSRDARKAVQTFDRGEMNGQTIHVTIE